MSSWIPQQTKLNLSDKSLRKSFGYIPVLTLRLVVEYISEFCSSWKIFREDEGDKDHAEGEQRADSDYNTTAKGKTTSRNGRNTRRIARAEEEERNLWST
jgi:hypothetical protein